MKIKIEVEVDTKTDRDELEDLIEQLKSLRDFIVDQNIDEWEED